MNYNTVIDVEESKPLSIEEKENNLQQKKVQKALLTTPDKETQIQKLQQTFGLQKDVVERNLDKLNKKDHIQNINNLKLHKTSPKLNNYLNKDQSNYNNLISDLSDLNYFERQWRYVKNQYEQGRQTVELANIGTRQLYGDFNDEDNKKKEIINKNFEELQNDYGITGLQQIPGKTAQMFPILAKTFVSGLTGSVIGGATGAVAGATGAAVFGQLGPQAATPEEIVTVPATAALLGSKGAKAGFRLWSAKAMFELEAGLAFNEYQDITLDSGAKIDVNTARGAAIITGVVNAGLEYLGFQSIAKNLPGFSSLKKESIKKALKNPIINNKIVNYARDIGTTAATEGSTEFFQELVTAGIGNLAKLQEEKTPLSVDLILDSFFSEENLKRGKQSFIDGSMGGAGIAITGKVASSGINYTSKEIQKRKQASETKQKLNELSEIVEKTNIKKVNKPVLKDALNEITDNQNVYIDTAVINTFYQEKGIDPREIIKKEFGEKKANEFDEALENGQDIELPISEYMLSDDFQGENKDFFNSNAKLDPLDMTAQEWIEEESRLDSIDKEELEKEQSLTAEEKQKEAEAQQKKEESKTKVKQAVKEQLKEAGFNDKTSDTYARLYESTFNSLGERLGVDPIELFNEFAPKIEKLDEEQTKGFLQKVGDKIKKVFQKKDKNLDTSYRMEHQPNPNGARLDDMTGKGEFFPDDIYSPDGLRLYGDPKNVFDRESFNIIQSVRGKPDAEVTMYRAVPNDEKINTINKGDFVTLSNTYAKLHAESGYGHSGEESGKVISQKVKVKDLFSDGNDLNEFGYFPEDPSDTKQSIDKADLTKTKKFKDWFGDSKVVDENGDPLVVYHGTSENFEYFDSQKKKKGFRINALGSGHYFSSSKKQANIYSKGTSKVLDVYLTINNPYIVNTKQELKEIQDIGKNNIQETLKSRGFDGIIDNTGIRSYVVFEPTQIKSVNNQGTFDPSDPRIMFQDDTPIIRGAFQFKDGKDFNIKLFKDANLSTFLHETGHYYLELMGALSEKENAPQQIKEDFNNILKFLNVDKKSDIKTEQHEQFARAFEAYLMQGKAPSNALKDVFIRFKIWLTNLYLKMKNLNVELNDDINGVFDRIIATDNEIESVKGELNIDSMIKDTSVLGKKENAYKKAINDFNNAVIEKTTNKLMKQYQREKRKWYKEEMAQIKEEIEQELNQDKNYNLLKALQTGELELENQKIDNFKFIKTELKNYFLKKHREQIKTIPEFEIDIMYKEISEGEAGKRYEGGYTPSTFPEYFQNKKLTKKQVLNIFDKYKKNERLTEKQQSILDILYTEFNNDPQVSYNKYLEKEHEKNIFSLIENKLSPDDIEIMKQLEETEIVIDNITVGEILAAYEKIEKRESDSKTESVDSIAGYEELYNSAQEFTKNELNKLPRAITNTNGFALEIVAGMFDFESVDIMLSTLQDITPRSEYIETRSQNLMKERYPNLEKEETEFQEEIINNLHNEKREEVLRFELKWLLNEAPGVFREGIRKISKRLPPKPQLKEYAQNFIAKQNINNIKPHLYLNAEKKAAKEAGRLYAAGKIDLAFDQKKIELINHLKYIEAVKVKNDVEKTNMLFRKFNQPDKKLTKTRDINLVNIGRSILSRYGVGDPVKFSDVFLKKTQEYDPVTYEILQPLIQDALIEQQDIKQISYNDFLNLKETIQTLWDLSRSNKEIELQDIKYDKDQLIEELSKDLPKRERAEGDSYITRGIARTENFLLNLKALATRIESWVDMMDKGNPDGIWRKVLFTPISEASETYRAKKTEKIKEFLEIVKSVEKEIDDTKIDAYEINHTFNNKGELIMALLHTGNKSNLAKLLLGYKWGSLDENNKLLTGQWDSFIERMIKEGVLTKTHFDFAQNVWDLLDSMKADAQRAHKKVYGNYFNEITAQEINTPFGTYKGGYFPAKVDPNKSIQQTFYDEAKIFDQNNNFMFPSTGSGFAKERVESFADKLELNVRVVPAHIDSVLKFTYIEPVVRNTAKLFYDKKFIKTLSDFDFDIVKNTIMPYLKRATSQRITTSDNTDANKIWSTLRKNVGMNFMFMNVANAMMQFTGLFLSASKVSSSHLLKGANQYLINTNRKKLREEISNKSVFMANRIATSSIEISKQIEDIVLNPNLFQKAQSFSQKHAYFLQTATQDIVDTITWLGAYNEAIQNQESEKQAVRIADSAVRQTQGTFNPEDLSAFETGSTFMRVILMFYNYFNMKSNLTYVETKKIVDEFGAFKGSPQLALLFTKLYLLPVAVTMGIKMLSNGTIDEDEDGEIKDDLSKRLFYTFTEETTGMFPIGGLIIQNAINQTDDEFYNDRLTASPVVSAVFENFSGIVKQASNTAKGKELNSRALIKKSATLLGSITGLPLHAVGRSAGYVIDVKEGDAEPKNNLDYIRGVITGKRGN